MVVQFDRIRQTARSIDERFGSFRRRYAVACLRHSLAVVFVWFGIIKPLGQTPATMLVGETLAATPILEDTVPFWVFMPALGCWEALVGVGLLFRRTIGLAVACMMVQMAATFVPLVVVPELTFHSWPLVPRTAGFYILKNVVLLTGGLVVTSHYRSGRPGEWVGAALAGAGRRVPGVTDWNRTAWPGRTWTIGLLRAGLCVIFCWAGLLTLSGNSEMATWIAATVEPVAGPGTLAGLIGTLELSIGLCLLSGRGIRLATYLAVGYLLVSLLPLVLRPSLPFGSGSVEITFAGAYLIKDWILVSAVLAVASGHEPPTSTGTVEVSTR